MSKTSRWITLILLGICTFSLGLMRHEYIINIVDYSSDFLLKRNSITHTAYPLSFSNLFTALFNDPRWTSSFIYLTYPALATIAATRLLFNKKSYLQITLCFYCLGLVLLLIMITLSVLLNNYSLGYGLAQHIKKIYQEPYISLLLLGGFYWDYKKSTEG